MVPPVVVAATTSRKDAYTVMFYKSAGCLLLFLAGFFPAEATLELPNISGIDNQLLRNLEVDNFFSYWTIFKNDNGIKISGKIIY